MTRRFRLFIIPQSQFFKGGISLEKRLAGKVALVTGGTRGIGRATALVLGKNGATVAVNFFKNRDSAQKTVKELEALGVPCIAIRGNVGSKEHVGKIVDRIRDEFGKIDILVSNAALGLFEEAIDMTDEAWELAMSTNAKALLNLVQGLFPIMQEGGKVIAITSLGSQKYLPGYSSIGASKAALEALVRYLAVDLSKRRISVNAVSGGFVDTEAIKGFPNHEGVVAEALRRTPFHRLGTPEDIARVVLFLASEDSSWITGQVLVADGGFSLT